MPQANEEAFLPDLTSQDVGIAERFKRAMHSSHDRKIHKKEVHTIFDFMLKDPDHQITAREVAAVQILKTNADWAPDGKKAFVELVTNAKKRRFPHLGAALFVRVRTEEGSNSLQSALAGVVMSLGFRSPKQRAAYTSGHYQAIMKLVRQQKIDVVAGQFKKEFLDAVVDDVHTNNRIYLNDALTSRGKTVLAVFQITIAILDWQDLKMLKKFAIADALIAGCLADSRVDMANWEGVREVFGERTESFLRIRLSRFFPGDPFPNIPGWERTYEEIVKALESGQVGTFTPKRLNSWMTMHAKKEAKKEQNLFAKLATPFSR